MRSCCRRVRRRRGRRRGHADTLTRLALLAVALCACGDNVEPSVPHDGSRLRHIDHVFDDGTRATDRDTFFDELMQETCFPTEFSDGARYCMPSSAWGEAVFTDDRCTQPNGYLFAGQVTPKYFTGNYIFHGQTRPSRLYRAGSETEAPKLVWWVEDNMCLGPEAARSGTYFDVTDEVTTDQLVRIRERSRIPGARLEVGVDTSDDGLFAFGTVYDTQLGACDLVAYPGEAAAECIPRDVQVVSYYADSGCTQPIVWQSRSNPVQQAVWFDATSACATILDVADPIELPAAYERIDGNCVHATLVPGSDTYATRPAETMIATMGRVLAPSARRMSLQYLIDGPLSIPARRLFDHDLDSECALDSIDGELRCVPLSGGDIKTVFADSTCNTTIDLAFVHEGMCDPLATYAAHLDSRNRIEAPYVQPFYELDTGDTCSVLVPPTGYRAYSVGPVLLPEEMARATVEVQR